MKGNNYAYGKCFTCAKKFTLNPLEILEDFKEDINKGKQICPGIVPAALYCDEHLKGARRRRFYDGWCQWFFLTGRIEEDKLLRWAMTFKGADIEGDNQRITISIHDTLDIVDWNARTDDIVKGINQASERVGRGAKTMSIKYHYEVYDKYDKTQSRSGDRYTTYEEADEARGHDDDWGIDKWRTSANGVLQRLGECVDGDFESKEEESDHVDDD